MGTGLRDKFTSNALIPPRTRAEILEERLRAAVRPNLFGSLDPLLVEAIRDLALPCVEKTRQRESLEQFSPLAVLKARALKAPLDQIYAAQKVPAKRIRSKEPCYEGAEAIVAKDPTINVHRFCIQMDRKAEQTPKSPKYKPPSGWKFRSFLEQYQQGRANTVSAFLSRVKKSIRAKTRLGGS